MATSSQDAVLQCDFGSGFTTVAIRSANITIDAGIVEVTELGNTGRARIPTVTDFQVSASANLNESTGDIQAAQKSIMNALLNDTEIDVRYFPFGTDDGYFDCDCRVSSFNPGASAAAEQTLNFDLMLSSGTAPTWTDPS